jgi:hypothetical protein
LVFFVFALKKNLCKSVDESVRIEANRREIPGVRSRGLAFQALIILRRLLIVLVSKTLDFLSLFHTFLRLTLTLPFGLEGSVRSVILELNVLDVFIL